MPKKKLFSDVSQAKLAEALMANYAGRIGGVVGLDRDVQLKLMNMADSKANWWRNKFSYYHDLRTAVAQILRSSAPAVPAHFYGLAYAFAQKIAKTYAMYKEEVADRYVEVIREEFSDLITVIGNEATDRIVDVAKSVGKQLYSLYRLGNPPPTGGAGGE